MTSKHQQALSMIMFFSLSFAVVNPHRDGNGKHHHHHQQSLNSFSIYNSFETPNNTKITAQIGGTAILPCIVDSTSPATVNWIRRSDYSLLTVGLATYSSDERFHVEHTRHKGVWDLRIKNVRKDDEGVYECNLSHHPPESIFIELNIIEALAEISGTPDVHIDEGSTLRLECKILHATEYPTYVFWYHENKMVNFDSQDGYSVLKIPKTPSPPSASHHNHLHHHHQHHQDDDPDVDNLPPLLDSHSLLFNGFEMSNELPTASSILMVQGVQFKHAGNYTCSPSNVRATSINVHVLKGDKPAAMKHSNQSETAEASSAACNSLYSILSLILIGFYSLKFMSR